MTYDKLILMIDNRIRELGLGTPPPKEETMKVLKGIAVLVGGQSDPECGMTNRFHVVMDDLENDVLSEQE